MKKILLFFIFSLHYLASNTISITQVPGSPFGTGTEPVGVAYSPDGFFLAVANNDTNNVSVFEVDQITGVLTEIIGEGSPFATGAGPIGIAYSPNGNFFAVANDTSDDVSVFTVEATGALMPASGAPFTAGDRPFNVAFSPDNRFLAVANDVSGGINIFSVDQETGFLTGIGGSPFDSGYRVRSICYNPDGNFLFASEPGPSGDLHVFVVNQSTGFITETADSPFPTEANSSTVSCSPNGLFVSVSNTGDNSVTVYSINKTTGFLTAVPGSPFAVGNQPRDGTYSQDNFFLISANTGSDDISIFSVDQISGVLTELSSGSPINVGGDPRRTAFSPNSTFFAVTNFASDNVSVFKVCYSELGSDTQVSNFNVQPFICDQGRIAAFASLNGGFAFENTGISATFASFFSVSGNVDLLEGTLILENDLVLQSEAQINTIGDIEGNDHVLSLASNISTFPQVAPSGAVQWSDVTLELNNNVTLQDCIITFVGNSVIRGNGNILMLDATSEIQIAANANLLFENIIVEGLDTDNISPLDSTSSVSLQNAQWILSNDFTVSDGSLHIESGTFTIIGDNNQFIYSSGEQSTLDDDGTLVIDNTITNKNEILEVFNAIPLVNRRGTMARVNS